MTEMHKAREESPSADVQIGPRGMTVKYRSLIGFVAAAVLAGAAWADLKNSVHELDMRENRHEQWMQKVGDKLGVDWIPENGGKS